MPDFTRMEPRVKLENVSKAYRMYPSQLAKLKEGISLGRLQGGRDFWALRDINLEVQPGVAMGILGRNGAGKSTLLQVISGVLPITTGSVHTRGTLVLLQLGAGFNKEFTGRENVMLNGLILGIDRKTMIERMDDIEEFADLGDFMDQPIKTYSNGMRSKLGFAVAVNVEPDILIVDESLSVGDAVFKRAGMEKMYDLRDRGTTILFVSHSASQVRSFCSEAALLHRGRLLASGDIDETLDRYEAMTARQEKQDRKDREEKRAANASRKDGNHGGAVASANGRSAAAPDRGSGARTRRTGEVRITAVEVLDGESRPARRVPSGSPATLRAHLFYDEAVRSSRLVVGLHDSEGREAYSERVVLEDSNSLYQGKGIEVDFTFDTPLPPDTYRITASVAPSADRESYMDFADGVMHLEVTEPENGSGAVTLQTPDSPRIAVRLKGQQKVGVSAPASPDGSSESDPSSA